MPPKLRSVNNLKRSTLKEDRRRKLTEVQENDDLDVVGDVDSHLPLPKISFIHSAIIVSVTAVICYWNSCDGDFVFDDSEAIIGNKDVNPQTPLYSLFIHDFWGTKLASNTSHKSYRPLTVLTFRWNYWLAGGLKPWGFHVVNIILHSVNCVLLLPVFSVILAGVPGANYKFTAPKSSFLCALLFAVHPIHSESVAAVVGRADLLCTLCVIISFLLYVNCFNLGQDSNGNGSEFSWLTLLLSFLFCGLAMLFKEQGITVLGVCCAYDIIMVCRIDLLKVCRSIFHSSHSEIKIVQTIQSEKLKGLVYRQTSVLICGVLLLIGRWQVMGSTLPTFKPIDNPASFEESFLVRVINFNYIYSLNCWILLNPWWLCFDWSMGCIPLIKTIADPRIMAPLLMWLVLSGLIWRCLAGVDTPFRRTSTMGIAFLVIPFLPAANVFFRVGFVVAERVLYLPSVGFCVLVVLGFSAATKHFSDMKKILSFVFGVLLLLFAVRTIKRSAEWTSDELLYISGEHVCPLNAKVQYNIGKILAEKNQGEEALRYYKRAVSLNPNYDQALNNLGNLLRARGEVLEAENMLEKAVKVSDHPFPAGWMNLGTVKAALNKPKEAEQCYLKAIKFRRNYPDAYFNLGNLYIDLNQRAKAIAAFQSAITLNKHHLGSWTNYMLLLEKTGDREKAVQVGYEALKHLPNEAGIHFNLGNMLGQLDRFKDGENHFLKSLELKPDLGEVHGNLGVLYHRWGKLDKAEVYYRKALKLEPHSVNVNDNLNKLLRLKRKKASPAR